MKIDFNEIDIYNNPSNSLNNDEKDNEDTTIILKKEDYLNNLKNIFDIIKNEQF
jgi:hypothetical protein